MKEIVKKVFNNVFIDNEAKKALLSKDNWIDCVITQIKNRLPNENVESHLINICNNIINYSSSNYPYPGYMDLINNCDGLKNRPELHQLIQEHYLWIVKVNYINKYYMAAENNDDIKKWIIESLDECFYPYGEFMNCLFKKYFLYS